MKFGSFPENFIFERYGRSVGRPAGRPDSCRMDLY